MASKLTDPATRVADRIRRWLDTAGLNQRDFAQDIGKSQVWLQKVLAGENHVRLRDVDTVAHAMRTTASELVRDLGEQRYMLELTPTEVRIIEKLRRRPEFMKATAALLGVDTSINDEDDDKPPPPVKSISSQHKRKGV